MKFTIEVGDQERAGQALAAALGAARRYPETFKVGAYLEPRNGVLVVDPNHRKFNVYGSSTHLKVREVRGS